MKINNINSSQQNFGIHPTHPILKLYRAARLESPETADNLIKQMNRIFDKQIFITDVRNRKIINRKLRIPKFSQPKSELVEDLYLNQKKVKTIPFIENEKPMARLERLLKELKKLENKYSKNSKL